MIDLERAKAEADEIALSEARGHAFDMERVASAYEKALVGLGWDPEAEGANAFAMRFWQTFAAMRSLIAEMRNPLPDPPPSMDDFHKVTLEVSYGAIRQMDAISADADGFQKAGGEQ